jgi:hypothetical protein
MPRIPLCATNHFYCKVRTGIKVGEKVRCSMSRPGASWERFPEILKAFLFVDVSCGVYQIRRSVPLCREAGS